MITASHIYHFVAKQKNWGKKLSDLNFSCYVITCCRWHEKIAFRDSTLMAGSHLRRNREGTQSVKRKKPYILLKNSLKFAIMDLMIMYVYVRFFLPPRVRCVPSAEAYFPLSWTNPRLK